MISYFTTGELAGGVLDVIVADRDNDKKYEFRIDVLNSEQHDFDTLKYMLRTILEKRKVIQE